MLGSDWRIVRGRPAPTPGNFVTIALNRMDWASVESTGEYSLERLAKALTDRGYKHETQTLSSWTDLDGTAGR